MTTQLVRGIVSIAVYFSALGAVLMYCSLRVARSNLALFKSRQELDMGDRFDLYSALFFLALAVIAGVSTWYYIGCFFKETFLAEGQGTWLLWAEKSSLFVQAYRLVSQSPEQWFWSSQLLMAACSFVGCLLMSGRKDAWAFVLLGFLGAISVALALFLSDQVTRRPLRRLGGSNDPVDRRVLSSHLNPLVSGPIIAALLSIMANSWIDPTSSLYMPNLIFLHIILFVPAIAVHYVAQTSPEGWRPFWLATASFVSIYMIYQWGLVGWAAHDQGLPQTAKQLLSAVYANNCQISITLDLFYVTFAIMVGIAWALTARYRVSVGPDATPALYMMTLLVLVPLLSVSLAFPLLLALADEELFARS